MKNSGKIKARRNREGTRGVFALKELWRNSVIARFDGYEIGYDTKYSLTLGGVKIEPTGILKYLNHSCEPNAFFQGRVLVAGRHIGQGAEVTIDYFNTETTIVSPFVCHCGSAVCRGEIRGDS